MNGDGHVTVTATAVRRGHVRFAETFILRNDPLGLVRSISRVASPHSLLVLPRRHPVPRLELPAAPLPQWGEAERSGLAGEAEEFASVRDYRPGDPMKRIHWRKTAAVGHPVVCEYELEHHVRHGVVLDTFADPEDDGTLFEEAVSAAASLVESLTVGNALVDLMAVEDRPRGFSAGFTPGDSAALMETLACIEPTTETDFTTLTRLVERRAGTFSGCVCVLLAWDEPRRELVRSLTALGLVPRVLVVRVEEDEQAAPSAPESPHLRFLEAGRLAAGLAGL